MHKIDVATKSVDFSIMGNNPVWLSAIPSGKSVG
jgi:hypothetical protein